VITGHHPFFLVDESKEEYIERINSSRYRSLTGFPKYAEHLFSHLCSEKSSNRYSTTEALEHPWFNEKAKFPLTFDEIVPWASLKPVLLAVFYTANTKLSAKYPEIKSVTVIKYKTTRLPTTKSNDEREKLERRKRYANVVKFITQTPQASKTIREYEIAQAESKFIKYNESHRGTQTELLGRNVNSRTHYESLITPPKPKVMKIKSNCFEKEKFQKQLTGVKKPQNYKSGKLPMNS
jgi:serine/threonine protein kinase